MDTLREFLLARILEEESLAQHAIDAHEPGYRWEQSVDTPDDAHQAHWNPWRVLSSCVAKRLVIAAHRDVGPGLDRRADADRALKPRACSTCGQYDEYAIEWPCYTLRVLALDWVEHPDYRLEWRPQRLSSGVGRAPAASASVSVRAPEPRAAEPVPPAPSQSPDSPAEHRGQPAA
jgi:hypothetical protein